MYTLAPDSSNQEASRPTSRCSGRRDAPTLIGKAFCGGSVARVDPLRSLCGGQVDLVASRNGPA